MQRGTMVIGAEQQKGEAKGCNNEASVDAKRAVRGVPMVKGAGCFGVLNRVDFHVEFRGCERRILHELVLENW